MKYHWLTGICIASFAHAEEAPSQAASGALPTDGEQPSTGEPWPEPDPPPNPALLPEPSPRAEEAEQQTPSNPVEVPEPAPRPSPRRIQPVFELSGLLGVVGSPSTGGMTFGGPRIGLTAGAWTCALSFYPSLIYSQHYLPGERVRPTLGFGPEVGWHGVTLFFPTYFVEHRYVPTIGLGYRFHFASKGP